MVKRAPQCMEGSPPEEDNASKAMKNNLTTYFQRQSTGHFKKTSEGDRLKIQQAQGQYLAMNEDDKLDFAKSFQNNRGQKGFLWMKEFTDSLEIKKKTTESALEKYMTRSFAIKGSVVPMVVRGGFPQELTCLGFFNGGIPHMECGGHNLLGIPTMIYIPP
jgi:hypothetical protein